MPPESLKRNSFTLIVSSVINTSIIVHFKRLGSRGFHDYLIIICFFSKHIEYCKTEAVDIWVNFSRFLTDVLLMIFINIKCQWDFIMEKKRIATLRLS